jgi:hypothetical protein
VKCKHIIFRPYVHFSVDLQTGKMLSYQIQLNIFIDNKITI